MNDDFWGEPIYEYSRQQAIADGVLVDVSIMAQEAGITYPTAVTRRVWDELVVPDEDSRKEGQCADVGYLVDAQDDDPDRRVGQRSQVPRHFHCGRESTYDRYAEVDLRPGR